MAIKNKISPPASPVDNNTNLNSSNSTPDGTVTLKGKALDEFRAKLKAKQAKAKTAANKSPFQ